MSIDQRVANIVGRLEIILPQLSEYRGKTDNVITEVAMLSQRLTSELGAITRELGTIKKTLGELVPTPKESRSKVWDVILLLLSNLVGLVIGWQIHP